MTFVKTAAYQFQQLRLKKMAEERDAEQVQFALSLASGIIQLKIIIHWTTLTFANQKQ